MKIATQLKALTMLGLTTLTLAATPSQADNGYFYFGSNPMPAPWVGVPHDANPWMMNNPAMQQARYLAAVKQRVADLDKAQDAQMQRILNGMESGRVTLAEAVGLIREHVAIANLERKYTADGKLGMNELESLEQRLAEAGRHIKFETKDREKSGPVGGRYDGGRPDDAGRYDGHGHHDQDRGYDYGRR